MEQNKKVTHLGGKPGQNQAVVTEESRSAQSEIGQHAKGLLKRAGELFMPEGAEYLGTIAVHYYGKEFLGNPTFFFATQLNLQEVEEGHAGLGVSSLRKQVMELYGHTEKVRS